uniref:Uncharacterized protein n=1 Tax=Arundo donax TaxID=35708 RepID=A0A0A9F5N7_ARUDO
MLVGCMISSCLRGVLLLSYRHKAVKQFTNSCSPVIIAVIPFHDWASAHVDMWSVCEPFNYCLFQN